MQGSRKVYSFSSVGELESARKEVEAVLSPNPIGISTPIRFGTSEKGTFDMHSDLAKQIRDNFRNMVATNHGERLVYQDFGANLQPLTFELGTEQADSIALQRIANTTKKYMPFISLNTFESITLYDDNDFNTSKIKIIINYSVPSLFLTDQVIEVIFTYGG
jgi:phage baseplate assembly protein W